MWDVLDWAKRFVATPSVSRDGNRAIASLARTLLAEVGLDAREQTATVDGVEHCNVIADVPAPNASDDARGLLLLTHLDTVPPGDAALWTETDRDPFRPTRKGDRLYGLGAADAKVDFVCKALALARLDRSALRRPLRLVGTFAEEIGLRGARHLVATQETRNFRWALVGEPSELVAMYAHKGYAVFEATLRGDPEAGTGRVRREQIDGASAHSSTPALGANAIERALERIASGGVLGIASLEGGAAVNKVPDACSFDRVDAGRDPITFFPAAPLVAFHRAWRALLRELSETTDPRFDPDHTVGNLGRVRLCAGRPVFTFDLRPVPGVDPERALRLLEAHATVRSVRENPALWTDPDSALVRAVRAGQRAAGLPARIATKATCTEAGLLSDAGLEAVVIGAGPSVGNVHRPNEYTRIPELEGAIAVYRHVARALCGEEETACSD